MPTEVYKVASVRSWEARNGVTRYDISLSGCDAGVPDTIVSTTNALRASMCQRALDTDARIAIGWRETKYGNEAITVVL